MIITPEDLNLIARTGFLGLISLCFYVLRAIYTEFKRMQKDVMESTHGDKLLYMQIENLSAQVNDLKDIVHKVLVEQRKTNDDK